MKILLTGASSQTGQAIYKLLKKREDIIVAGTYYKRKAFHDLIQLNPIDSNSAEKIVKEFNPDIIIHTSALNLVDYCEEHKEEAFQSNAVFTESLLRASRENTKFIYFSTEYIFDGKSGPYKETDKPNPISIYGASKLEGEKKVIKYNKDNSVILRTTVIYGEDLYRKNFVLRLIDNLKNGNTAKIPKDQISSPTYTGDISRAVMEIIDKDIKGIYNLAGSEIISRSAFALKIAEIFNLDKGLVIPVLTETLNQPAKRPLNAGLIVDKIHKKISFEFSNAETGLKRIKNGIDYA